MFIHNGPNKCHTFVWKNLYQYLSDAKSQTQGNEETYHDYKLNMVESGLNLIAHRYLIRELLRYTSQIEVYRYSSFTN